MTDERTDERDTKPRDVELDPGAYIGSEPEREAETLPGGTKPGDERIAAQQSAPGVPGEPNQPTGGE